MWAFVVAKGYEEQKMLLKCCRLGLYLCILSHKLSLTMRLSHNLNAVLYR